jgi:hypothetical protein
MRGRERERFLSKEKTKFLCSATATGTLYLLGDFPGLVLDSPANNHPAPIPLSTSEQTPMPQRKNGNDVRGELFEIFDPITFFETLDVIEGYWPDQTERSLFVRKLISVETDKGETKAWAYILNLPINGLSRFAQS